MCEGPEDTKGLSWSWPASPEDSSHTSPHGCQSSISARAWDFSPCPNYITEHWLAAQPQPTPRLVTDAADPGLDLQIDFLAWPHTCLFPTNLPDGLNSCLVLSPSSWFALLGYGGMQLVVLHSAPRSLSLSKRPALTDRSHREPKHLPFGNQKSLSHAFLFILNTKYANWSWSLAHANFSLCTAGLCSTWLYRKSTLAFDLQFIFHFQY